jgi:hypothetical protein
MTRRARRTGEKQRSRSGAEVIAKVLAHARPRPTIGDEQGDKIKYAVRFADAMAAEIAADLHPLFPDIAATTKREASAAGGKKQLDVNFSTPSSRRLSGFLLRIRPRDAKASRGFTFPAPV